MKAAKPEKPKAAEAVTEFLILPDGRLLVHNLTPTMAAVLSELNPKDEIMKERSGQPYTHHATRNTIYA